ncbi:2-amino-4-hydroxy-6-hydroxymethyldihydropteridine diphosphokinase [Alkalilimnicola sp. S0819]|uniref:2-amino-4-hydroxy-6- hydroxymethyldihydropteridine diphosphokinase n=1 Tax=Alkalilimnicola sp. S0819 TaxID=2613922 RepID=UPI00126165A0|nr:2-amino-4-hydroxy-6-hydroxymethyldihydropteridine diphosphokinase [Alkalilimnicola sp. S0819]KAB7627305.1 2-amino-4-hydroxy-6-hydroxymethyldihydropteridine diphosphokinase [Alkalilimnicola sp. S0819]MPQ16019.1 hypothetical protein [Alkalilimnicola sp. S0819]
MGGIPQMGFLLGFGSNIAPVENAGRVLEAMSARFGPLCVSSAYRTEPVGMRTDTEFLNMALYLPCELSAAELKRWCCGLETSLGRDRSCSDRKWRDRPADLDLLSEAEPLDALLRHGPERYCDASYMRAPLRQLFAALGGQAAPAAKGWLTVPLRAAPPLAEQARWLPGGLPGEEGAHAYAP